MCWWHKDCDCDSDNKGLKRGSWVFGWYMRTMNARTSEWRKLQRYRTNRLVINDSSWRLRQKNWVTGDDTLRIRLSVILPQQRLGWLSSRSRRLSLQRPAVDAHRFSDLIYGRCVWRARSAAVSASHRLSENSNNLVWYSVGPKPHIKTILKILQFFWGVHLIFF